MKRRRDVMAPARHVLGRGTQRRRRTRPGPRPVAVILFAVLMFGLVAGSIGAIVAVTSAGTTSPTSTDRDLGRVHANRTSLGGQHVGILIPPQPNGVLVIAAHGHTRTAEDWLSGPLQASVRIALLEGGYSIAASDASGSAWGNPRSVADYTALYDWAQRRAEFTSVALIGESMGGLASLQLATRLPMVKAWVGVFPVCNLRSVTARYPSASVAWAGDPSGLLSPVDLSGTRGLKMIFFASPDDLAVPKDANTDLCAQWARAAGADVEVVTTTGGHGDPTAFQPTRVLRFLNAATGN